MKTNSFPKSRGSCRRAALAKIGLALLGIETVFIRTAFGKELSPSGLASWYGEEHRGKLMANGRPFDPDKMTAASWHYPLGTNVRVAVVDPALPSFGRKSVLVKITDRGPAKRLVGSGRIIDLSHAAFRVLASPELGLIQVELEAMLGA
jgi:rare lipoprotein A